MSGGGGCSFQESIKAFSVRELTVSVSLGTWILFISVPPQCQAQHPALSKNMGKYWLNWTELETEIEKVFQGCIGA